MKWNWSFWECQLRFCISQRGMEEIAAGVSGAIDQRSGSPAPPLPSLAFRVIPSIWSPLSRSVHYPAMFITPQCPSSEEDVPVLRLSLVAVCYSAWIVYWSFVTCPSYCISRSSNLLGFVCEPRKKVSLISQCSWERPRDKEVVLVKKWDKS